MKDKYSIIHTRTITLDNNYTEVKSKVQEQLSEWSEMFEFDDNLKGLKYRTEGPLIPEDNGKLPVLILLSNPHPHSVWQGMILSPNRSGIENPFWNTMRYAGYFTDNERIDSSMMIQNRYESPFRFFMSVLLPFPSDDPSDLTEIFDYGAYSKMVSEGKESIQKLVLDYGIRHVVCFSKLPYDALSRRKSPKSYTGILKNGEVIMSNARFSESVKMYLTFPTGWRFTKNARELKAESLRRIFENILSTPTP